MDNAYEVLGVVCGIIAVCMAWNTVQNFTVNEGFVGLLYRRGRFLRILPPGRHRLFGYGYDMNVVDGRKTQITVPGQDVLTSDNIGIKISVLLGYRIVDAAKVTHEVQNFWEEIYGGVQVALRESVGSLSADGVLGQRLDIGTKLRERVAPQLSAIGIETLSLDIKDVMLPADLRRAFTDVIKARSEGLATLERARAESASMRNLANAAKLLDNNPSLLKLRTLQTLESGGDMTLVMGSPFDLTTGIENRNGTNA